jgi:hypothetical protein
MFSRFTTEDIRLLPDKEIMILIGQDPGDDLLDARKVDYELRLLNFNIQEINNTLSSEILIANLYNSIILKKRAFIYCEMNPGDFTKINKSLTERIKFREWQSTVFNFEKSGYIQRIKGQQNYFTNRGYYTRIKPTEKFINEIIKKYNISYKNLIQRHHLIELRDKKKVNKSAKRVFDIERRLKRYNNLLVDTDINFSPYIINNSKKYNLACRTYKRVFNNSFSKNGRFYGPCWQSMPKKDRAEISINGEKVIELDYEGMFINLLYSMRNLNMHDFISKNEDPYDLKKYNRKIVKAAFTACVNKECNKKNINYVVASLAKKILKDKFVKGVNYRKILELLSIKHPKIGDMFYQDLGDDLCFMESRVTDLILNSLARKQIPVLAIHDSFMVPISKSTELYNSMINAFNTLGYTSLPNIKGYPAV